MKEHENESKMWAYIGTDSARFIFMACITILLMPLATVLIAIDEIRGRTSAWLCRKWPRCANCGKSLAAHESAWEIP